MYNLLFCSTGTSQLTAVFPRFLESELELHDAIEELHSISVAPEHYPVVTALSLPHSLLALVGHDNTDIAAAVLDLLQVLF